MVADFVAGAFGLRDRAEALRERYVGAILDGQTFRVWFHWPMAHDNLPAKLDDYYRPEQSLSETLNGVPRWCPRRGLAMMPLARFPLSAGLLINPGRAAGHPRKQKPVLLFSGGDLIR